MALTDSAIRALVRGERLLRKTDGGGLDLEVSPRGSKVFRLAYRKRFDSVAMSTDK